MAKHINNTNFDNIELPKDAVEGLEQHMKALKKEVNKKVHVSVLLSSEDFNYVNQTCFDLGISKNEFYKRLLDEYRQAH